MRYPGRGRDSGTPSSGHLQSHREMLPEAGPESGVPGKVERGAERERAAEAATSRGHDGASNQVCWCEGEGNNAGLMKVKQTLPNLVAKYMKDLEADEKDGLSPDLVEMWKEGALDVVRDALEYLKYFGEGDPASRPDDALGPLRKAVRGVATLTEIVAKEVQEPDEERL